MLLKSNTFSFFTAVVFICSGLSNAIAENLTYEKNIGDNYKVHFSAVLTDTLAPATARTYNIQRSSNRAMVSVSVLNTNMGNDGTSVTAEIAIEAHNLTGQNRNIKLNKVVDSGAIYYIGTFPVTNREKVSFALNIKPEGASQAYNAAFKREFFIN